MSIIKVEALEKEFKIDKETNEQVLKGLHLEIQKSSVTAIYGPSGCGKSTLLNIISGLDREYEGQVFFSGQSLKGLNETEITNFRKKNIGFVFQNFNLIPHLSVLENVLLPMHLNGKKNAENKKFARQLLAEVELDKFESKNVTQLSGGQKQRVAIARALSNDPEVIIADEPTGSLDSKSSELVLQTLKNLTKNGKTVIIVTHSDEVVEYADTIIRMKDGEILSYQKIQEDPSDLVDNSEKKAQKPDKKKRALKVWESAKIAFSNFKERKLRNSMISIATAIGLVGILISLGLGSGITSALKDDMDSGNIPSQIQISLRKAGTVLNSDDVTAIEDFVGKDKIKYFESPFAVSMTNAVIDGKSIDFSTSMPAYSQIVSLFTETNISVSVNSEDEVAAGKLYTDNEEEGLTITTRFIDAFNEQNHLDIDYEDYIGKIIEGNLMEATSEGNKTGKFSTKIVRVVQDDEIEESNSYMSKSALEKVISENNFSKNISYMVLELKNPQEVSDTADKLNNKMKKYLAISQADILEQVIQFIKIIQGLLIVMSIQAVLVSVVMIAVIIHINIIERTKEIGVMKAVGYQNKDVKSTFIFEALIITALSFIISVIIAGSIGYAVNYFVTKEYPELIQIFLLDTKSLIGVAVLSLAIGFLSALLPVRRVSKTDPVEALRYE